MLEDVIGWIIDADAAACLSSILIDSPPVNVTNLVARLKDDVRATGGLKKDSSTYEAIAGAIGANEACCARARALLNAITEVVQGADNPLFVADPNQPTIKVFMP